MPCESQLELSDLDPIWRGPNCGVARRPEGCGYRQAPARNRSGHPALADAGQGPGQSARTLPVTGGRFQPGAGGPHNVDAGNPWHRAGGHDGVIAFGGGSALDVGKLVAFMVGQTRPMWDFEDIGDWRTRADFLVEHLAPVIAVLDHRGNRLEVGRAGVITDAATHAKKVIFYRKTAAIRDLRSGADCRPAAPFDGRNRQDALAHCLEAYCAPGYHPMADGIAVEGIRLVKENLARVVADGNDVEGRGHMMSAAAMG